MIQKNLLIKFKEIYNSQNKNIQETILELKNIGATQMDCLKIIKKELKLSIKEADNIILNSKAWSNHLESNLNLRDSITNYLENIENLQKE